MAYPLSFHRLVLGGDLYTERFNTSLSIVGGDLPAVSDPLLAAVAGVVGVWFHEYGGTGSVGITDKARLTEIKLNRIGTNGRYQDATPKTHLYPTPIEGGNVGSFPAPQLATVATLETAFPRGRAARGRMYLPPTQGFISPGPDGRAAVDDAVRISSSVSRLINQLRAAYLATGVGSGFPLGVAVMSDVGTGTWHYVTKVSVGRVIDTMRSRRSSLAEDRQDGPTAITPA